MFHALYEKEQYTVFLYPNNGDGLQQFSIEYNDMIDLQIPSKEGYVLEGVYTDASFEHKFLDVQMPSNDLSLYCKWDILEYTVTVHHGNGEEDTVLTYDYGEKLVLPNFETSGYVFEDIYLEEEYTTVMNFSTMPSHDVELYAKYHLETYDIIYHLNGGFNHPENPDEYTMLDTLQLGSPSKEESQFIGWYLLEDLSGNQITEIEGSTQENINVYASWKLNQYPITYHIYEPEIANKEGFLDVGETIVDYYNYDSYGDLAHMAFTSDHRVFVWGKNRNMMLGSSTESYIDEPTDMTPLFSLQEGEYITDVLQMATIMIALTNQNRIFNWGMGLFGITDTSQAYFNAVPQDVTSFIGLQEGEEIVDLKSGRITLFLTTSNQRVLAWGYNLGGEILTGDQNLAFDQFYDITDKLQLQDGEAIQKMSIEDCSVGILTTKHRLLSFGPNVLYQNEGDDLYNLTPVDITSYFPLNDNEYIRDMHHMNGAVFVITNQERLFFKGYDGYLTTNEGGDMIDTLELLDFGLLDGETIETFIISRGEFLVSDDRIALLTSNHRLLMLRNNQYMNDETPLSSGDVFIDVSSVVSLPEDDEIVDIIMQDKACILTENGYIYEWDYTSTSSKLLEYVTYIETTMTSLFDYSSETKPLDIEKEGYEISSWYTDPKLEHEYVFTSMSNQNIQLYAKWEPKEYLITYHTDMGELSDDVEMSYHSGDEYQLPIPDKTGHTFMGWYPAADFEGDMITRITSGMHGDLSLYANYMVNDYELRIHYYDQAPYQLKDILGVGEHITRIESGYAGTVIYATNQMNLYLVSPRLSYLGQYSSSNIPVDMLPYLNLEEGETIVDFDFMYRSMMFLTSNNRLLLLGNFYDGNAIYNYKYYYTVEDMTPKIPLQEGETIIDFAAGGDTYGCLTDANNVYVWGENYYGTVGNGTTLPQQTILNITQFIPLEANEIIIQFDIGSKHAGVLTNLGQVYLWGDNSNGELGMYQDYSHTPSKFMNLDDISDLNQPIDSLEISHKNTSLYVGEHVYSFGNDRFGQINNYDHYSNYNDYQRTPIKQDIIIDELFTDYRIGDTRAFYIRNNLLYVRGFNRFGELGLGFASNLPEERFRLLDLEALLGYQGSIIADIDYEMGIIVLSNNEIYLFGDDDSIKLLTGEEILDVPTLWVTKDDFYNETSILVPYQEFVDLTSYELEGYTISWYVDPECEIPYIPGNMPSNSLDIYGVMEPIIE